MYVYASDELERVLIVAGGKGLGLNRIQIVFEEGGWGGWFRIILATLHVSSIYIRAARRSHCSALLYTNTHKHPHHSLSYTNKHARNTPHAHTDTCCL